MEKPTYAYQKDLNEIARGINDLMADLEDVRDDAADCLAEQADLGVRLDLARMDAALRKLMEVAEALEDER